MTTIIIYAIVIIAMSMLTIIFFAADKKRAKSGRNRLPELMLLISSALGGALGGLVASHLYHHKTDIIYFHIVIDVSLLVHIGVAVLLVMNMLQGA